MLYCLLISTLVFAIAHTNQHVGCRGKCCAGRNSSCISTELVVNDDDTSFRNSFKNCYCDSHCTFNKDCCQNRNDYCKGKDVDCRVSTWSDWSQCSKKCGTGESIRQRTVIGRPSTQSQNVRPCPVLMEKRICQGISCPSKKSLSERRRIAIKSEISAIGNVVPEEYSQYRDNMAFNREKDIRRNLYKKYYKKFDIQKSTYCGRYKITSFSPLCRLTAWSSQLFQVGHEVCVTCHRKVMKKELGERCSGEGIYEHRTTWKAFNSKYCHGSWIKLSARDEAVCSCPKSAIPNILTFV